MRLATKEAFTGRFVRLGPTPFRLREMGLGPADLVMSVGKIVRAMKDHPSVPLDAWLRLPTLLESAVAGFPSARGDGSIVAVIIRRDDADDPIVVPIQWDAGQKQNVVLSVYGRSATDRISGDQWIAARIVDARRNHQRHFDLGGFADAKPKPEPASTINASSWSPGSIPADRSAKPKRQILTLNTKVKNTGSTEDKS